LTLETFSKIAIAYSNRVSPANVTAVTTSGISAFLGGFPASNLEYPDPWTMMKTASISGEPIIQHTFAFSITPRVLGLINHNLFVAGYTTVQVEYFNGTIWVNLGTVTLPSTDQDLLIPWTENVSATQWRWRLGSAQGNFFMGSVFYGIRRTFDVQAASRGVTQSRRTPLVIEQSAGGARHVSFGADRRTSDMQLTWNRGSIDDRSFFEQINHDELIGIVSPEHGDAAQVPSGSPIFWGYVESVDDSPRGPGMHLTAQKATYDFTVSLRGAA